ncbi:6,7-dimethyl-8-ribityllumazine synthase [Taibaiella lutea]|uniref:6,7-dimethyl-8-ribityllumazine synthase n=1 Tax=Taibaiella lutea TaxID=2608001 RepID=A0A5M6CIR3_9BACT|nr:6,7-dimethyl-8-ribityllumazine synthase [Taibaiella lutea]KAA5534913.1 6,7-dimethyl-8-ribityllumazine synthase [Taibaiella lutea]
MALSTESNNLLNISSLIDMENARVAIVATEWNDKMVAAQIEGAKRIAQQCNSVITHEIYVPGSFELPFACKAVWDSNKILSEAPEAIIAFGAVIRGGTPHFEYVCKAVTEGVLQLNLTLPIPVIFGVLTLNTEEEAWERLGGKHGHKGEEAMITALKMIKMKNEL